MDLALIMKDALDFRVLKCGVEFLFRFVGHFSVAVHLFECKASSLHSHGNAHLFMNDELKILRKLPTLTINVPFIQPRVTLPLSICLAEYYRLSLILFWTVNLNNILFVFPFSARMSGRTPNITAARII